MTFCIPHPGIWTETKNHIVWFNQCRHWTSCFQTCGKAYVAEALSASLYFQKPPEMTDADWACVVKGCVLRASYQEFPCKLRPVQWGKIQEIMCCRTWDLGRWFSRKLVFFHLFLTAWSFTEKMFLRQHSSISFLARASCFAYVVCLCASHIPLLSLPCLEQLLLFCTSSVNVYGVWRELQLLLHCPKNNSQALNSLHGWISRLFQRMLFFFFPVASSRFYNTFIAKPFFQILDSIRERNL